MTAKKSGMAHALFLAGLCSIPKLVTQGTEAPFISAGHLLRLPGSWQNLGWCLYYCLKVLKFYFIIVIIILKSVWEVKVGCFQVDCNWRVYLGVWLEKVSWGGCRLHYVSHSEYLKVYWSFPDCFKKLFKCYVQNASRKESITAAFTPHVVEYIDIMYICQFIRSLENKWYRGCMAVSFCWEASEWPSALCL